MDFWALDLGPLSLGAGLVLKRCGGLMLTLAFAKFWSVVETGEDKAEAGEIELETWKVDSVQKCACMDGRV